MSVESQFVGILDKFYPNGTENILTYGVSDRLTIRHNFGYNVNLRRSSDNASDDFYWDFQSKIADGSTRRLVNGTLKTFKSTDTLFCTFLRNQFNQQLNGGLFENSVANQQPIFYNEELVFDGINDSLSTPLLNNYFSAKTFFGIHFIIKPTFTNIRNDFFFNGSVGQPLFLSTFGRTQPNKLNVITRRNATQQEWFSVANILANEYSIVSFGINYTTGVVELNVNGVNDLTTTTSDLGVISAFSQPLIIGGNSPQFFNGAIKSAIFINNAANWRGTDLDNELNQIYNVY